MDYTIRRRKPTRDLDDLGLIRGHDEETVRGCRCGNTARTKIESMTQGVKTFTHYWNEFRLTATEANYDDKTMQRLLLRGFNRVILDAWAQDNRQVVDVDDLAQ